MNEIASQAQIANMSRIAAELMPEYLALQKRLRTESPNMRRAVANALSEWVFDPTLDMSLKEKRAYLARLDEELVRRVNAELVKRGEAA
jgi:hypothetical protein